MLFRILLLLTPFSIASKEVLDFTDYDGVDHFKLHPGMRPRGHPNFVINTPKDTAKGQLVYIDSTKAGPKPQPGVPPPPGVPVPNNGVVNTEPYWKHANLHNPWYKVIFPHEGATRTGYDYTKGGYAWGGYGRFGAIDVWEEVPDTKETKPQNSPAPVEKLPRRP